MIHNVTEIRQFSSDFLLNFTLPSYPIYNSLPIPKTKQNKDKNQKLYLSWGIGIQRLINVWNCFCPADPKSQVCTTDSNILSWETVTNIWDIIHSKLFTTYNTYHSVLFLITFIKRICRYLLNITWKKQEMNGTRRLEDVQIDVYMYIYF